jgi:bifunctional UDP-N-acetylglucosamine pyrophosphorylase/glucosamine-1-phosphate N-acetyltransferase
MTRNRELAAVVLAAGQGKRMAAPGPKVLVRACGRALVEHVLDALAPLGPARTVVVYGHGGSAVRDALAGRELLFAHQPEQRGTGHAVQCALPALGGFAGDVLVLCGDTPLLTTGVLEALVADHRRADRALTVLSAELADPGSLGRILRDERGELRDIREIADATPAERAVSEINTGVMVIGIEHLAGALRRLTADNAQGEYYLTDVPGLLLGDGLAVGVCLTADAGAALGVNNPQELAEAVRLLQERAGGAS